MQTETPEVFDIRKESQSVLDMYGEGTTASGDPWDAHADIMGNKINAKNSGKPFAALIRDLKQRGMWKGTLVICGSEYGRAWQCFARLDCIAGIFFLVFSSDGLQCRKNRMI